MDTTLKQIRSFSPCELGWSAVLKHLGKTRADDVPLSITTILASNGLADALWCLRAVKGCDREIRLYAVWCARHVQHLMTDQRSLDALDVAERFANGQATRAELTAARIDAEAAMEANHGEAARIAARTAAWTAAWIAAWAVRDVADAAAEAAAWSVWLDAAAWSVWADTWTTARDASRAAQTVKLIELCGNNK